MVLIHFALVKADLKRHFHRKIKAFIRVPCFFLAVCLLFPGRSPSLEWISWPFAPKVAFTFDDGPRPGPTKDLCDVLARHQALGTFFVVGRIAAGTPETLRFLAERGHEVANHTWTHPDVRLLSEEAMRAELDKTRVLIKSVTGQETFLFRTPGSTEAYLRRSFRIPPRYQLVLWDVHSLDQEGRSARQIADRVLAQIKSGDVVLMHNGLAATRGALEIILPALRERGFQFVTVSDLLRDRPLFAGRPVVLEG